MFEKPLCYNDFFGGEIAPFEPVFTALARAEDRVSRLDERVRASGFISGWRHRSDIRAVLGAMSASGQLVHAEDLILHDLGADARVPDTGLFRARNLLQARRKALLGGPELLGWSGVAWLSGLTKQGPPPGVRPSARVAGPVPGASPYAALSGFFETLTKRESDSPRGSVEECLAVLDLIDIPPLLQAAALLEAWRVVDPLPAHRATGALAASVLLKVTRRFDSGLFPVEVGLRRRPMSARLKWAALSDRLSYWLGVIEAAADRELDEVIRLGHQKTLIERKAAGGRRNSMAPQLARLAVESPALTTQSISSALGITPQASLQLVRRLDGALFEITGRSRFRVWRL